MAERDVATSSEGGWSAEEKREAVSRSPPLYYNGDATESPRWISAAGEEELSRISPRLPRRRSSVAGVKTPRTVSDTNDFSRGGLTRADSPPPSEGSSTSAPPVSRELGERHDETLETRGWKLARMPRVPVSLGAQKKTFDLVALTRATIRRYERQKIAEKQEYGYTS